VANSLPSAFLDIPKATVLGIPTIAIVVAVVIAIGAYYLRSYRSGRELYAIGSNPDAARLAGIPVGRRVFMAFTASGAIAGVAGVLWAAQYGTIDSTAGTGYELQVISAVVVGGVAIFGGSGSAVGARRAPRPAAPRPSRPRRSRRSRPRSARARTRSSSRPPTRRRCAPR